MAKKEKKAKKRKSLVDVFKNFAKFKSLPELDKLPVELRRLNEKWDMLPKHVQEAVLILTRVRPVPSANSNGHANVWHSKPGQDPEWLAMALNILKDSKGYLTDTEIAKRIGVHRSTLCRSETYRNAKQTYLQPFLTSGRRGVQEKEES